MRIRAAVGAMLAAAAALSAQPASDPPHAASIREEELRADLFFLAGDRMRGRLTATPENDLAAEWVKARFERLGLEPAGPDGSYFQPFALVTPALGADNGLVLHGAGVAPAEPLRVGDDYHPARFSATARVRAGVAFAGFGISSPERGYSDYAGTAAAGRVVLVLDHEPGEHDPDSVFDGVVASHASMPLMKALAAQDHGAVGILFVEDLHNHPAGHAGFARTFRTYWPERPPRIATYHLASWIERVRIPAAYVSRAVAERLLRGAGRPLEQLARGAESPDGGAPLIVPEVEIDLTTNVTRRRVPDRNVLAQVRGRDLRLRDEWVIVGAHLDHNGADGDRVFTGADDNGSGVVGVLEIAEAYALAARDGQPPRRSVLFAVWNAEERGLLGAWAFADQKALRARVVSVLNLDMIGRSEEVPAGGGPRFHGLEVQTADSNRNAVNVIGTTRSPALAAIVEQVNRDIGLDLRFRYDNNPSNLMRRSDHWPFLQHGVPAVWFHTGLHPDYHTEADRPEKIEYGKMQRIVRLVHGVSWRLAEADERPALGTSAATTR